MPRAVSEVFKGHLSIAYLDNIACLQLPIISLTQDV